MYESFIPAVLWQEYGISSYVRGSAQQLVWQSYYMLADALRHETPRVVVFNVLSLMYGEPQSEAYNRMTLDGMEWSSVKVSAIRASATAGESLASYLRSPQRIRCREAVGLVRAVPAHGQRPLGRPPRPPHRLRVLLCLACARGAVRGKKARAMRL